MSLLVKYEKKENSRLMPTVNIDPRIFNKVLTNQTSWTSNPFGFMIRMSRWVKMQKSINMTHFII